MFNQLDFKKLLDTDYLFETYPPTNGLYLYLVIIFAVFIFGAIATWWINRKNKSLVYRRLLNSLFNLLLTIGILGLFLIFFRWQEIPYLGNRIAFIILFFVTVIWGGYVGWYRLVILPKEIKIKSEKDRFEKYLPRPKIKKGK